MDNFQQTNFMTAKEFAEIFHLQIGTIYSWLSYKQLPQVIKCIDFWLNYHNSKPCSNDKSKTIKDCLNSVHKEFIDRSKLNHLMMKIEPKIIHRSIGKYCQRNKTL